jgi:hypothetical protein
MQQINGHNISDRDLGLYQPGIGNNDISDLVDGIDTIERSTAILKRLGFRSVTGINLDTGLDQWFWRSGKADFTVKNDRWQVFTHGYVADCQIAIDWQSLIGADDPTIERAIRSGMDEAIERVHLTELLVEAAKLSAVNVSLEYQRSTFAIDEVLKPSDFSISICKLINVEFDRLLPDDRDTRAFQVDWHKVTIYSSEVKEAPALELTDDRALVLLYELRIFTSDFKADDLTTWQGLTDPAVSQAIGFPFTGRL